MKKLMIAAAIVCAAALSQAATANWLITETVQINNGSGTATALPQNTVVYIYGCAWGSGDVTQKDIYDLWVSHGDLTQADGYVTQAKIGSTGKFSTTEFGFGEQSTTGTGAVSNYYDYFFVIDDGDQIFLSTTKTKQKSNSSATAKTITISSIGDSTSLPVTGGVAGAWNNVPEPTSGLLLLLGVAGLALRRRRA